MPAAERIYSALLFLFPAAAWVNIAPALLGGGGWINVALACLMFVFLPVEFFSSHLWALSEQFSLKSALDNVLRRVLVDMIDVLRILSLSIAYAMAPVLVVNGAGAEGAVQLGLFWWGVGWFLLLNRAWNWALSPLHKEIVKHFKEKAVIERENRIGEPLQNKLVDVFYKLTVGALVATAPVFAVVFPLLGFFVLGLALCLWIPPPAFAGVAYDAAVVSVVSPFIFLVLMIVQVALKTGQISALSILNSSFSRSKVSYPMSSPQAVVSPVTDQPVVVPAVEAPNARPMRREDPEAQWCARAFVLTPRMRSVAMEEMVDLRELITFRTLAYSRDTHRSYPGATNLVLDDWDRVSTHFIVRQGKEIVGAARLCPARDGRLPVSEEVASLDVGADDLELGRMLVRADKRNGLAAAVMLAMTAVELEKYPHGRLYVDTVAGEKHTFGDERLLRMGFSSIGRAYQDVRYGLESHVYLLNNRRTFLNWCRRIRLTVATSV